MNKVERKFQQMIADSGYTEKEFSDQTSYWNYLQDELIIKQNCSNQFAWNGEQTCKTNCIHVKAIAEAMQAKFPEKN